MLSASNFEVVHFKGSWSLPLSKIYNDLSELREIYLFSQYALIPSYFNESYRETLI